MSLPSELTYVTVTGQVAGVPTGAQRAVRFVCPVWLFGQTDNLVCPPFTVNATINTDGSFSVSLPATNDPAWTPQGWSYTAIIQSDGRQLSGTLVVPYDTVGSIDIADEMVPDQISETGVRYLALSLLGVANGVAELDANGDVNNASGSKIRPPHVGNSPPASPVEGDIWFDTSGA